MKYVGAVLLILVVCTIMVEGTYSQEQMVEVTFELVATESAQPNVIENAITQYTGVRSVSLLNADTQLAIEYDQAKISMDELLHIITSFGYDAVYPVVLEASL